MWQFRQFAVPPACCPGSTLTGPKGWLDGNVILSSNFVSSIWYKAITSRNVGCTFTCMFSIFCNLLLRSSSWQSIGLT